MRDDGSAASAEAARAASPLKLRFFPDYTATTPYRDALYSAFGGIDVAEDDPVRALDRFCEDAALRGPGPHAYLPAMAAVSMES